MCSTAAREAYKELKPADVAYYDGCIELDLSTVECMIALPMHPSYAYTDPRAEGQRQ